MSCSNCVTAADERERLRSNSAGKEPTRPKAEPHPSCFGAEEFICPRRLTAVLSPSRLSLTDVTEQRG